MDNSDFNQIFEILKASFDKNLYRTYDKQKKLLDNPKYNIMPYKKDKDIIAFLSYWTLEDNLLFLEHFAVAKSYRGQGIGKELFNKFLKLDGTKVLEVEPPIHDIDKKRIKWYESFDFIFHENEYYVPSVSGKNIKLNIMCNIYLDDILFEHIVKKIYKEAYKQ